MKTILNAFCFAALCVSAPAQSTCWVPGASSGQPCSPGVTIIVPQNHAPIALDNNLNFVLTFAGNGPYPSATATNTVFGPNVMLSYGMKSTLASDPDAARIPNWITTNVWSPAFTQDWSGSTVQQQIAAGAYTLTFTPSGARQSTLYANDVLVVNLMYSDPTTGNTVSEHYEFPTMSGSASASITMTATPQPVQAEDFAEATATSKKWKLTHGTVEIPRGDILGIGDLKYSYASNGASGYTYHYTFDTTHGAVRFRLSGRLGSRLGITSKTTPAGWIGGNGPSWCAFENPSLSESQDFQVESTWSPGLIPLYFQSDWDGLIAEVNGKGTFKPLPNLGTNDNKKMAMHAGILHNSLMRYGIGPAFPPGSSPEMIAKEIAIWAEGYYGFSFLKPLVGSENLRTLSTLHPSNQFESDIVDCLRRVLH